MPRQKMTDEQKQERNQEQDNKFYDRAIGLYEQGQLTFSELVGLVKARYYPPIFNIEPLLLYIISSRGKMTCEPLKEDFYNRNRY